MTDASGSTQWAYDAMGRVLIEHRTIGTVTKNIAYTYNLDGSVHTLTYPSGRTITYSVSAAQRPVSAVDSNNNVNSVLNATYAPQGAVSGVVLGESGSFGGITYAATYTNRLLPYTVTATSAAANALNLTFGYYANGNVETITNNLNTVRTESFTYDNLNRVATAQSQATSGTYCWGQSFGYDRYGNLGSLTLTKCTPPTKSLSVNLNNQITNSGFTYDASGDMTSDGTYTYAWDARHRLQSAGGVTYTYDGDSKRVMKSSGTLYWNSPDGTPLAETNSSGTTLNEYVFFNGNRIARRDSSGNVYYYLQDQLGTTKNLTTSAGVVCYDADFLPFGGEMAYSTTCAQNYKFTGLERDSETGNDHTPHRMYDPSLGRWLSPDPLAGDITNPQSLNRYAYVLNNPTIFTDPMGLDCSDPVPFGKDENGNTIYQMNCNSEEAAQSNHPGGGGGPQTQDVYTPGDLYVPSIQISSTPVDNGSKYGLKLPNENFSQCMARNANTYSVGGALELALNVATDTSSSYSSYTELATGNSINSLLFGSAGQAAQEMAGNAPDLVGTAMGSALTYGRRTTNIMSLNLGGVPGGPPLALSQASKGLQSVLGKVGNLLNLGMDASTKLAIDAAFTAAEAIGCSMSQ
jgi:RHS repeat-associated protein